MDQKVKLRYMIEETFACYQDRAKNEVKIESSVFFNAFAYATIFCRPVLILFSA